MVLDIRKHIEVLANGESQSIYEEMKKEVDGIDLFFEGNEIISRSLAPQTQFTLKNMNTYLRKAQQTATCMDSLHRKIKVTESKPGIAKLQKIEKALKVCSNPLEYGRLNRDLRFLKSNHSAEMAELVSNRHQLLVSRLNIIQVWKSLLICEIHILEEGKNILIKKIIESAGQSDDSELQDMVHQKLQDIGMELPAIDNKKIDSTRVRVANVDRLRETLVAQLDNVVSIERTVQKKQQVFKELSKVFNMLKEQLPPEEDMGSHAAIGVEITDVPAKEDSPGQPAESRPKPRGSGMVYKDKKT